MEHLDQEVDVRLGPEPIQTGEGSTDADPRFGAACEFTGRVRGLNFGRQVESVHYDAFLPLTRKELERISRESLQEVECAGRVWIEHRTGPVGVGELSVRIRVETPHRDEAFRVCRRVIERLKHEAPIWKKEVYTDGETEWLKGHSLCSSGRTT